MNSLKGITNCIFNCSDCDKYWDNYKTAHRLAKYHAKKYKHKVHGDLCYGIVYNCREIGD